MSKGGYRPGAGRPRKKAEDHARHASVTLSPACWKKFRKIARQTGTTPIRVMRKVLEEFNR